MSLQGAHAQRSREPEGLAMVPIGCRLVPADVLRSDLAQDVMGTGLGPALALLERQRERLPGDR